MIIVNISINIAVIIIIYININIVIIIFIIIITNILTIIIITVVMAIIMSHYLSLCYRYDYVTLSIPTVQHYLHSHAINFNKSHSTSQQYLYCQAINADRFCNASCLRCQTFVTLSPTLLRSVFAAIYWCHNSTVTAIAQFPLSGLIIVINIWNN